MEYVFTYVHHLITVLTSQLDTTLFDKICQWLATDQWFSPGTPVCSTKKTDHHNIAEILLKVALNTIILILTNILIWLMTNIKDNNLYDPLGQVS
jgi:hypothetical protein